MSFIKGEASPSLGKSCYNKNPGTNKVLKCSTPILGEWSSTRQGSSELEVKGLEFRTYASRLILSAAQF